MRNETIPGLTAKQRNALEQAIIKYHDDPCHAAQAVSIGLELDENGEPVSDELVVLVRMQPGSIHAQSVGEAIDGVRVVADYAPEITPEILFIGDENAVCAKPLDPTPFADQRCYRGPIPGGPQIQPATGNWVGTMSGAIRWKDRHFCFTNRHVAGMNARRGMLMYQPNRGNRNAVAKVEYHVPVYRRRSDNIADMTLMDCRFDGKHRVSREQAQIGTQAKESHTPRIGGIVQKFGRTTLHTRLRVTGYGSSTVNYGGGLQLTFRNQMFLVGVGELGSTSGDSGSLILTDDNRPAALLFAGGGRTTIASPIEPIYRLLDAGTPYAA